MRCLRCLLIRAGRYPVAIIANSMPRRCLCRITRSRVHHGRPAAARRDESPRASSRRLPVRGL